MKKFFSDPERLVELGVALLGVLLLGGVGVLVFGRVGGDVERGKRHSEGPPSAGSVSPERQQNVGGSSPR